MARLFNGSSAVVTCAGGGTTAMTGAYTFAAIVKRNGTGAMAMMCLDTSGGAPRMELLIHSSANSNLLTMWQGVASLNVPAVSLVNADGWALIALSHSGAGAAIRGHRYLYSDGSVIHSNGSTDGNLSASGAGGVVTIGEGDGDFWNGDIAIAGAWNRELSDTEVEQLAFTQLAWLGSAPAALWHLDQSATGQAVGDLTGGAANQTSQANTAVSTNSVPVFNYGAGPWLVIRPQAAGGGPPATILERRTLSPVGTRVGSRQMVAA